MKYIKKFENISYEPEVGDYVLVRITGERLNFAGQKIINMLHNSIGKVSAIMSNDKIKGYMWLLYEDGHDYPIKMSEVIYHSKNKEDVQTFLDAQKYNL